MFGEEEMKLKEIEETLKQILHRQTILSKNQDELINAIIFKDKTPFRITTLGDVQ